METTHFHDRVDAGRKLAGLLKTYELASETVVFGLPRGGMVVAAEVARQLKLPLDVAFARKIGDPTNEEYAIGAVSEDGIFIGAEEEIRFIDEHWLKGEVRRQLDVIKNRRVLYLANRPIVEMYGKQIILIDDGIATGFTVIAAARMIKRMQPKRLVIAVPVMPAVALSLLRDEADEIMTLFADPFFKGSIGMYYGRFEQVTDTEVRALLT